MSAVTVSDIEGCFDRISWKYRRFDDRRVITGFKCSVPFYRYAVTMEVTLDWNWVYLRAVLFRGVVAASRPAVLRFLSQWNSRAHHARFLLVEDCVVIQAETAVAQWSFGSFVDLVTAVCRYSQLAGVEIGVIAGNPVVAELYEVLEESATTSRMTPSAVAPLDEDLDFDLTVNLIPD